MARRNTRVFGEVEVQRAPQRLVVAVGPLFQQAVAGFVAERKQRQGLPRDPVCRVMSRVARQREIPAQQWQVCQPRVRQAAGICVNIHSCCSRTVLRQLLISPAITLDGDKVRRRAAQDVSPAVKLQDIRARCRGCLRCFPRCLDVLWSAEAQARKVCKIFFFLLLRLFAIVRGIDLVSRGLGLLAAPLLF